MSKQPSKDDSSVEMHRSCHEVTRLTLPQATITSVKVEPAGVFQPHDGIDVPMDKPFCRVTILATPEPGSDIGIEVWLPTPEDYNGRFWGIGNSGLAGSIRYDRLGRFVNAGYTAVSTDGGNQTAGSGDLSRELSFTHCGLRAPCRASRSHLWKTDSGANLWTCSNTSLFQWRINRWP